jgi:hypothetical protein
MSLVMKRPALMLLLGIALVAVGFGIGLKTGRARPFVAIAASPSDHSATANKQFDEPKPIKAVTKPASESDAPAKEQTRDWKRPDHIKDFVVYDDGGGRLVAYFSVVDTDGRFSSFAGEAVLTLRDRYLKEIEYRQKFKASDFRSTTLGSGAFAREATILRFRGYDSSFLMCVGDPPRNSKSKGIVSLAEGECTANLVVEAGNDDWNLTGYANTKFNYSISSR